ncbi:MAG TPA: hypothetical protein VJ303_16570, partial [Steroidobacteraceae bacterium]|nr:hypothetical protein [Steroidobacteraceae bacterium]
MTEMLHEYRVDAMRERERDDIGEFVQVPAHHHHHDAQVRRRALQSLPGRDDPGEIAHELGEGRAVADRFVHCRARAIERDVQRVKAAVHARLGARFGEQREIAVGRYLQASIGCMAHHAKEVRVHERLAETLQMKLVDIIELRQQSREVVERQQRGRAAGRRIGA